MKQHLRLIELLLSAQLLYRVPILLCKKVGVGAVIAVIADLAITRAITVTSAINTPNAGISSTVDIVEAGKCSRNAVNVP